MNSILIYVLSVLLTITAWPELAFAGEDTGQIIYTSPVACNMPNQTVPLTGKACDGYKFAPMQISCLQPSDVQGQFKLPNLSNRQRSSDLFSWQTFVALNWPASNKERGVPAANLPLSANRPRVWETWKETDEIFLSKGQRPAKWNQAQRPDLEPLGCSTEALNKVLHRDNKVFGGFSLSQEVQPTLANGALPGTLTAQNEKVVRYEIRYNKTAFDYIVSNKLYNRSRQNLVGQVTFPSGSIIAKAAWLPIKDRQRAAHFQTAKACVCEPRERAGEQLRGCKEETVGLVGFHVMEKTQSAPQWIWSTFEQVDNVKSTSGISASFNNKNCVTDNPSCEVNQQTKTGVPNQIVRSIKIPDTQNCDAGPTDNVALLNSEMRAAISGYSSPLQYYQLVNSQWPDPPAKGSTIEPKTVFNPVPDLFGNTTLESFVQPTSSCMGCHAMARTTKQAQFVSADFTFTLDNAAHVSSKYRNGNKNILPAPGKWAGKKVKHGFKLMNNTYEMLPDKVNSKLHCSSCHLDAGRNPSAAWLVDMQKAYAEVQNKMNPKAPAIAYPESLYLRINGCMTRSMNGKVLCDSKEACDKDRDMQSLVEYTEWLTTQRTKYFDSTSPRGFPQLPVVADNDAHKASIRGSKTFQQKCAFCHGHDGQGRYESDTYYRPALWGKYSFNACAGMARKPGGGKVSFLAGFIKANMPLGSGGVLTDQEAWDLATYINKQCRPGSADKACLAKLKSPQPVIGSCIDGAQTESVRHLVLPVQD